MDIHLKRYNLFYEAFGEEAMALAKALYLIATKMKDGTPICGFPCSYLDVYSKIIKRDFLA